MGKKGKGTKKYKLVVSEEPWGCKVQHRNWSSQRTYTPDPWTWTMVWGWPEGVRGEAGWNGQNWTTVIAKSIKCNF